LNRLNINLFTPSLLFSKVAFFLSPEKLRELWIIPLFFVLVSLVSMTVSYILGHLFRLRTSQRSFAMAAAMFMNSNSLPIALMQSLVVTVPGLKWEEHDNKNAMLGRALTYLVLYSTLGMVVSTFPIRSQRPCSTTSTATMELWRPPPGTRRYHSSSWHSKRRHRI
jgi:predicted permease